MTSLAEVATGAGADSNPWVRIVAGLAAAAAFVALFIIGTFVVVKKWKLARNNRVQSISLEHIIYDASDPATSSL